MGIDREKTIRTMRLALTCIFLFFISWYYEIPESVWSLITIWFVMYEYNTVGGVLNKSMLRFVGTTCSALYGMLIIYFCDNDPLMNLLALIPGLFIYSYFFMGNDKAYTGTIGAVTLTIVLLNYNNIDIALLRVFNVLLGIVASVFMIRFFYPQYARNFIIENQLLWLDELIELLNNYLDPNQELLSLKAKSKEMEHTMLANLATYQRLVNEAKMETKNAPFFLENSLAIKDQIQPLFHLIHLFISFLSTDETRAHPWIIEQIQLFLKNLNTIRSQLLDLDEELIPQKAPPPRTEEEHQQEEVAEILLEHKPSIDELFAEVSTLLGRLKKEVTHLILIYDHYECAIHPRLRI